MPLYEYECEADGRRFEVIQKFSDPPITTCPTCGGAVRKLLSSPAIQFKGSGFYITDYPKKSQSEGGKSQTENAGTKSESSSAGGDSGSSAPSAPRPTWRRPRAP